MNFSLNQKLSKGLSLVLVMSMMAGTLSGCSLFKTPAEPTEPSLNLNLSETTPPTETTAAPTETTAPIPQKNMATVTSRMNVRSSPSTDATVLGTLEAGDRVELRQREIIHDFEWGYMISPTPGWIVMDFVEMDNKDDLAPGSTEPTTPAETAEPTEPTVTNAVSIKGTITANGLNIRDAAGTAGKVVGGYDKGESVTILETKDGWGRTNKGWIKMDYVQTSGNTTPAPSTTTNNNTTNKTPSDTNVTITGNGSTNVILKGVVLAKALNVRSSASTAADAIGSKSYGDRVEVMEKDGNWGRTKDGWISLDYVYQDGTTGANPVDGTITGNGLNIRSGPGTNYGTVGSYDEGDSVRILQQFTYSGKTWGCTNKGWISMSYVDTGDSDSSSDSNDSGDSRIGTTTTGLNVREGAGKEYGVVGGLPSGSKVTILEEKDVDGTTWGRIEKGWISLSYVDFD